MNLFETSSPYRLFQGDCLEVMGALRKESKNVNRQISLPPELDARLKALSEREGRSFSSLLVSLILKGLDG